MSSNVLLNSGNTLTHYRWDPRDLSMIPSGKPKHRIFENNPDFRLENILYVKVPSSMFMLDDYGIKIEYLDISDMKQGGEREVNDVRWGMGGLFAQSWMERLSNLYTVYTG